MSKTRKWEKLLHEKEKIGEWQGEKEKENKREKVVPWESKESKEDQGAK